MARALDTENGSAGGHGGHCGHGDPAIDWRKGMSNNVAYALLVYTGLHIFVTVKAMADGTGSLLPYLALVALIALIIPACRAFERRWVRISDDKAHDPSLRGAYRRDQAVLWTFAIGLPLLLTAMFKALLG